jgi:FkbM family methyltransferase
MLLAIKGISSYEPETMVVFKSLICEASSFLDIGANIGAFTLAAKSLNPAVSIWAFEPDERICSLLAATVRINQWTDVIVEQIALSDFNGDIVLFVNGNLESSTNPQFRSSGTPQRCRARTLDSYCSEKGISSVDVIKVDTESTEPAVLAGGRQLIGDCKPAVFCEVLAGRTETHLTDFLRPLGYIFYHLTDKGPVKKYSIEADRTYRNLNYLFVVEG